MLCGYQTMRSIPIVYVEVLHRTFRLMNLLRNLVQKKKTPPCVYKRFVIYQKKNRVRDLFRIDTVNLNRIF